MAELEAVIEQKLIEQLIYGDSQWIYRGHCSLSNHKFS